MKYVSITFFLFVLLLITYAVGNSTGWRDAHRMYERSFPQVINFRSQGGSLRVGDIDLLMDSTIRRWDGHHWQIIHQENFRK